jgi:predicted protein tyrosine phosphatase
MTDHICREIYRGEQIALQVLDRELARDITHEEPYAFISITDPHGTHPRLARSEYLRSVLTLQFSDVDRVWPHLQEKSAYIVSFTPEMARQVAAFVREHQQQGVHLFVVHCEAGMSRSAGIAAALSRYYNEDEHFFLHHYRPNPLVRQIVLEALQEHI